MGATAELGALRSNPSLGENVEGEKEGGEVGIGYVGHFRKHFTYMLRFGVYRQPERGISTLERP